MLILFKNCYEKCDKCNYLLINCLWSNVYEPRIVSFLTFWWLSTTVSLELNCKTKIPRINSQVVLLKGKIHQPNTLCCHWSDNIKYIATVGSCYNILHVSILSSYENFLTFCMHLVCLKSWDQLDLVVEADFGSGRKQKIPQWKVAVYDEMRKSELDIHSFSYIINLHHFDTIVKINTN